MKVIPIALYLKERIDALPAVDGKAAIPLPAPVDHSGEIEEAFARGRKEGEAAARADFEIELQRLDEKHRSDLANERASWAEEQGSVLAARLQEMVGEMERQLSETVAQLLEPILVEAARRSAIAAFCAAVKGLWEQQPGEVLHISGPGDLIDAVKAQLGETIQAQYSAGEACEARVEAGEAVIETQFTPWAERLREAMT